MGSVKVRYYVTKPVGGRPMGYWQPTKKMKLLGFSSVACGPDGPAAWAKAEAMNEKWRRARTGQDQTAVKVWPRGSLGEAFQKFRQTQVWANKAPRTREDWNRGWALIEPIFGDVAPSTVDLEAIDQFYQGPKAGLLARVGTHRAFHTMKIWRALWRVAGAMGYCNPEGDPSQAIRRKTPSPRSQTWREGEIVRLVKQAIRDGFPGLACIIAVAWDTQLAPVDIRKLTHAHIVEESGRMFFRVNRAKSGAAALGTLSRRTERLCRRYIETLGVEPLPAAILFRLRSGAPYSKDTLSKDFRKVRGTLFPGDLRSIGHDMRRSGTVEAIVGNVEIGALAAKMANTIDQSRELQQTYNPTNMASVLSADQARRRGRRAIRENG